MDDDGTLKYNTTGGGFIYIRLANYLDSLEIHNLTADYTSSRYYGGWTVASPTQSAIEINTDVGHLVISHCNLYNNVTDGIAAVGSSFKNVLIQYCNISHSGRSGISLDTSDNVVIDNCNISYSGDMRFELDGYKNEGPGCAINSEPTVGHTKNLTITNCKLYGCAYTYISLGYTNKKANENGEIIEEKPIAINALNFSGHCYIDFYTLNCTGITFRFNKKPFLNKYFPFKYIPGFSTFIISPYSNDFSSLKD